MDNNLLAVGTRVQLTGILKERYGVIYGYSTSVTSPYLVKTDDGNKITCGDKDIQTTFYTHADLSFDDTSFTISAEKPKTKFEKDQLVFYEMDYYTREIVVITEVDTEDGDYYISYVDGTGGSVWAEESELSEISDNTDCLDKAIANYHDLGKALISVSEEVERLEGLLRTQRVYRSTLKLLVDIAADDVLKNARELGSMED